MPRALFPLILSLLAALFLLMRAPFAASDMDALLPPDAALPVQEQALLQAAEAAQGRQLLLLVGADAPLPAAQAVVRDWQASGLVADIAIARTPPLDELRTAFFRHGFLTLPPAARQQLHSDPAAYFAARAADLANPFAVAVLPPQEDWPGFSRFLPAPLAAHWQADGAGYLVREADGRRWLLIHATLADAPNILGEARLIPLIEHSAAQAAAQGAILHVAGTAVFAASSRQAGEAEGRWMSALGATLTLLLAGVVFRRARVLLIALPLACGLVCGLAAVVALCGSVHLLTLVIGSSLIGLLLDFPLHWLGKSTAPDWQADSALAALRRPFLISLLITLAGYAFLLATPLPILRQSAVFALAALPTAWLTTLWTLPPLFRRFRPRANPTFGRLAGILLRGSRALHRRVLLIPAIALLAAGLWHSDWQDDIRQWVALPPQWLQQAAEVARISGVEPAAQQYLLRAVDEDALLRLDAALAVRLDAAKVAGAVQDYSAISQWVWTTDAQAATAADLQRLAAEPAAWQALTDLGIPAAEVRDALRHAAANAPQDIAAQLDNPLAVRWQGHYLGRQCRPPDAHIVTPSPVEGQGQQAPSTSDCPTYTRVTLYGVRDSAALAALADGNAIRYHDRRARLNTLFGATRSEALWLKLASYLVAWGILRAAGFNRRDSLSILAVPLAAAFATVALLRAFAIPISLFAAFGLLLISAIGVDYAVYAKSGGAPAAIRYRGMLLAALTTITSFGILALSATPAVAAFGATVAIGIALSLTFATWLFPSNTKEPHGKP
ncbi:MMPL family transporter [Cardiobacterium valvarum]|uniref:Membrane transport protein MMPL domain-containing protein n=1 Tax=Cardiobacterium valvarum F0432 TaxID=797473 RepID=G9ZFI9_9GAMM|nr:hypothetical protein [Cardiobacterium valvarum]EHM53878.1 hypothetical protein HMPREF9080_01534 [Cardiobacterium valvarum F0432]